MTDIVANCLQWEPGIDKALHTGMSERMRTGSPHGDTGLAQIMACPPRHRSVCERDMRCEAPQEQEPVPGLRAVLQIRDDRLTYQWRKRVNRDVIGFALAYVQPFVLPIDIVKCQIGDLTSPQ